ncbi:MAG: serine hydrolase [Prevotellaceae bacterium]|jgi:beta-glucosidase-like glycosyl hydrolase/CubicO group peptidase (beta-lactamase class C family)|nr:serine hydrolase [Prevotellaceae bacterium]
MTKQLLLCLTFLSAIFSSALAQQRPSYIEVINSPNVWADSMLQKMTTREKIGQLIMVSAYSNRDAAHVVGIADLIAKHRIGGITFFQGNPLRQAEQTNFYQALSPIPLIIGMDAEWGVGMRLDSVLRFPFQIVSGAAQNDSLVYDMGVEVAKQFTALGMHVNFAPVADIYNNLENPVINVRSFSEDKKTVARMCVAYTRGMQDNGILACAKHFPGHGNTNKDSHLEIPTITSNFEELSNTDLYPFRELIKAGIAGMMVGHLNVPAIDTTYRPGTLSSKVTTNLLKKDLGFKGITFTDGMQMKAITTDYPAPIANMQALMVGNDLLVYPIDVVATIDTIEKNVERGAFPIDLLNEKCLHILKTKYWLGLHKQKPVVDMDNLIARLNPRSAQLTKNKLVESAMTLAFDDNNAIPLKGLDTLKIAYLEVGKNPQNTFMNTAKLYAEQIDRFTIEQGKPDSYIYLIDTLKSYNLVIVGYMDVNQRRPQISYGMDSGCCNFLMQIAAAKPTIMTLFAGPHTLSRLVNPKMYLSTLIAYNSGNEYQRAAAEALFGALPITGKSPIATPRLLKYGQGVQRTQQIRLRYIQPDEIGIPIKYIADADSTIVKAIRQHAMPGCQVLAAYKGQVFYNKSFGYHTYEPELPVLPTDLYDIASVTKVAATLPVIMKMSENKNISLNDQLGEHIHFDKKTDKSKLVIKDVLLHQSGLKAWIFVPVSFMHPVFPNQPLISTTQDEDHPFKLQTNTYLNRFHVLDTTLFSSEYSLEYPLSVAEGIYASPQIKQKTYDLLDSTELMAKHYRYSDLGFYYLQRIAEKDSAVQLDAVAESMVYKPLGMTRTTYLPLKKFGKNEIVPTEWEYPFRHQLIHGYVHDHGAATIGGVAGHAGLFSTSNDMAKYMQMLLWKGSYGGQQLLQESSIELITKCQSCNEGNRRALGFDKPEPNKQKPGPVCPEASLSSYGHTGFTGTLVWNDPERDLVFVFLSNRVHPDYNNNVLTATNVRSNLLTNFIKAIDELKSREEKRATGK